MERERERGRVTEGANFSIGSCGAGDGRLAWLDSGDIHKTSGVERWNTATADWQAGNNNNKPCRVATSCNIHVFFQSHIANYVFFQGHMVSANGPKSAEFLKPPS